MSSLSAQRLSGAASLIPTDLSEVHGDPYQEQLGPGTGIYEGWALTDECGKGYARPSSTSGVKEFGGTPHRVSPYGNNVKSRQKHTFHGPAGRPATNELWRFRVRGCQDCWAALFFVALVVVVLLCGAAQVWQLQLTEDDLAVIAGAAEVNYTTHEHPALVSINSRPALKRVNALRAGIAALYERTANAVPTTPTLKPSHRRIDYHLSIGSTLWLLACVGFGVTTTVLVAYGGLTIMSLFPRQLIFLQASISSVVFAVSAGAAMAHGSPFPALICTVMTFMPFLWIYLIQDRIPFTATMLWATVSVLKRHRGLFFVSLASVLLSWAVLVVFIVVTLPCVLRMLAGWGDGKDIAYPFIVAFTFFWVQEVVCAVVHVTVCGVVATWYFAGEQGLPPHPVIKSFERAVTTSFGSVCFGSLVTAMVSFIRFLVECVRSGSDQDSFWMCVLDCIIGCVEDLVRYFNIYAFVHVAVYGCSYVEAARETWNLVHQCVFSAVFNDCLTSQVIAVTTLMSALLVALLTGLATWSLSAVSVMFVMTWVVCGIFYSPIASCVTTIFVCFAEVPVGLQLSFPELYDALVDTDAGYTHRRADDVSSYGATMV